MTRARDKASAVVVSFTSTGIDDNADATAITIDSSENVAFTANANFGDSDKAQFGAGSDLQIYHDGSNSYISDQGTNDLKVLATDFQLKNAADNEFMMTAVTDGAVTMYHNNSAKIATSSTGATVTGVLIAGAGSIGMGPAFFAHPASGQSISANTFTKVVLGTEVYDTDSKFASSRFTPTIAGYYQINASVTYANANFTQTGAILAIYKNGSSYAAFNSIIGGFEQRHGINGSALVYLDSNDYVEMFIYGPGQTVAHDTGETHFSGGMVRKA